MRAGQVYYDFNSASPITKQKIAELQRPEGVKVCDVAVMSAVPLQGSKVPLLLSGDGADEFYHQMKAYGMRMEVIEAPAGAASAVKMIRSIFMKGYPQVLMECLLAAEAYGVTEKIIDSIEDSIGGMDMRQLADRFFTPTVLHASRRSAEMKEVVSMLKDMGHDFTMSEASRVSHENLAKLGLEAEIGADDVIDYKELVPLILKKHTLI
jgi:3-hydroxyisobutyrate dehydrogenase-like beta-hydroxyacid dehydrogenase